MLIGTGLTVGIGNTYTGGQGNCFAGDRNGSLKDIQKLSGFPVMYVNMLVLYHKDKLISAVPGKKPAILI